MWAKINQIFEKKQNAAVLLYTALAILSKPQSVCRKFF